MAGGHRRLAACHLGLSDYRRTWDLQKSLQKRLIDAKRCDPDHTVSHVLLLVEHPPVYTLGKSGDEANLLIDDRRLARLGATLEHIDRGGDITFHGPGQLVVYPILDLGQFYTDIHRYLRDLEECVIRTCAGFGLPAGRIEGRTGVWTAEDGGGRRKLCAMGIKCSRWVTCHGLALNVSTDLSYFRHIIPCGISDADVTSLSRELHCELTVDHVVDPFLAEFADVFKVDISEYAGESSGSFLGEYLAPVNS